MCAFWIPGVTRCPICGQTLDDQKTFLATSGVAFGPEHHLYPYCDAGLHLACVETWPDREAFARGYFEGFVEAYKKERPQDLLAVGEGWILGVGPAPATTSPYYAHVVLERWPIQLYSRWDAWTENVSEGFEKANSGQVRREVEAVLREVRRIAPTTRALANLRNVKTDASG